MKIDLIQAPEVAPGPAQAALIQRAIEQVHAAGGGVVSIGAGLYETTTLFLRSGVELRLERGARLLAHGDLKAYPRCPDAANNKDQTGFHLLAAFDCDDIAITGDGVIDGNDMQFWEPCKRKEDRPYGIFRFVVKGGNPHRPCPLVQIVRCRNVKLRDFTVKSSPGWALHVFDCDDVLAAGLTVRGHPYGPHTDGIGINGSRNVRVTHCDVDTGDDAIIIKSTNAGMPCGNICVTNCIVASNCAGLGLGADVCGSIRDVVFSNCVVKKSLRMIQIEMWFAGQVERAVFSGIVGRTFPDAEVENERPIYIDIQRQFRSDGNLGVVRDMVFRDIVCESRGRILMTAQDGARIDGVTLDNVIVNVPEVEDPAVTVPRATSLQLSNHSPHTRAARAGVVADNVDRLTLRDVEYRWPMSGPVPMHGVCLRRVSDWLDASPRLTASQPHLKRVLIQET